jgi:hypothetical protein
VFWKTGHTVCICFRPQSQQRAVQFCTLNHVQPGRGEGRQEI